MVLFRVDIEKIIRFRRKISSIGLRMRVLYPFEVQIFTSTPFKVTFRETSIDRRFFLEDLLGAILFLNLLIFLRSMLIIQSIRQIWLSFFPYNFTLYMVKPDKRKPFSPTAVRGAFSRRYRKNNQVRKKNRLDRTSDAPFIYRFEVQIFTSTPLKSLFVKHQMTVDFSSSIFWERFFF